MSVASILTAAKFSNITPLISAAGAANLPIWVAVAFVEKESHGANVYGHDSGGTFYGKGTVTQPNYQQFYDLVVNQHQRSNGVGPMQITWTGFHVDAKRRGFALYDPFDNFRYGFELVRGYCGGNYSSASLTYAGTRYNGAAQYGRELAARALYWQRVLQPPTAPQRTLRVGSTGQDVRALQSGLNRAFPAYSRLAVDGRFGRATQGVVMEFQSRVRLVRDGIVGPATRKALNGFGVKF